MRVHLAADVVERQELRKAMLACGLDLATVLADLRIDVGKTDGCIDVLFRATGDTFGALEYSVLVDLELLRDGDLPHGDVVGLGTGEVEERRPVGFSGYYA